MRTQDPAGQWHSAVDPETDRHPALLHHGDLSASSWGPFLPDGGPLCPDCEGHEGEDPEDHLREHRPAPDHGTPQEFPENTPRSTGRVSVMTWHDPA